LRSVSWNAKKREKERQPNLGLGRRRYRQRNTFSETTKEKGSCGGTLENQGGSNIWFGKATLKKPVKWAGSENTAHVPESRSATRQ